MAKAAKKAPMIEVPAVAEGVPGVRLWSVENKTTKNITLATIPPIRGTNGTIAQAPDICGSLSSLVRRSCLTFSSATLIRQAQTKSDSHRQFIFKLSKSLAMENFSFL